MTTEEAQEMIDRAAVALAEHFDAVFIVVSREFPQEKPDDPKYTQMRSVGRGNWFAQCGMLREVLERDQAQLIAANVKPAEDET